MRPRAEQLKLFEATTKPVDRPAAPSVPRNGMNGYDFLEDLEGLVTSLSQLLEQGMSWEEIHREFSEEEIQQLAMGEEDRDLAWVMQYLLMKQRRERVSSDW